MECVDNISNYLSYQGFKYIKPESAGEDQAFMLHCKYLAQAARKEFLHLAEEAQVILSNWKMHAVSHWMNQAQILRPHFWVYFQGYGEINEPMLALRLYGKPENFGVSLEVSFIERKKNDLSLIKQNRVLNVKIREPVYYFVQECGQSSRWAGIEDNRLLLKEKLFNNQIRKVLVKCDVCLTEIDDKNMFLRQLQRAYDLLMPFYEATRGLI